MAEVYLKLGRVFKSLDQMDSALYYTQLAFEDAQKNKLAALRVQAAGAFADLLAESQRS